MSEAEVEKLRLLLGRAADLLRDMSAVPDPHGAFPNFCAGCFQHHYSPFTQSHTPDCKLVAFLSEVSGG